MVPGFSTGAAHWVGRGAGFLLTGSGAGAAALADSRVSICPGTVLVTAGLVTGGATGGALAGAAAGLLLFFTAVASFSAVGAGLAGLLTTVSLVVGAAGSALTAAGGDLAATGFVAGVSAERGASAAGFG